VKLSRVALIVVGTLVVYCIVAFTMAKVAAPPPPPLPEPLYISVPEVFATEGEPTKLQTQHYYGSSLQSVQWSEALSSPPPSSPKLYSSDYQALNYTFSKPGSYEVIAKEIYVYGEVVQYTFHIQVQSKEERAKYLAEQKKKQEEEEAKRLKEERAEAARQEAAEREYWGSLYAMHEKHPGWSKEECERVNEHHIWNGMTVEMMKASLGRPDDVNVSDYGYGKEYQFCYDWCFLYDDNDDGIIDAYQTY